MRTALLVCGILGPLLYGAADGIAGSRWEGYSFRDMTVSELGAIGAPTQALFSRLVLAVYALLLVFGVGVWRAAASRVRLRAVGAFGRGFRLYSIVSMIVLVGFAARSGAIAARPGEGLSTPWLGVVERFSFYSYQVWFLVLAVKLLREPATTP